MSSTITNDILTFKDFVATVDADYDNGRRTWRETAEAIYTYFLGAVPPAFATHGIFAMGEPYTHDDRGRPVFLFFAERDGRYFAQHGTIADYKAGRFGPLPA